MVSLTLVLVSAASRLGCLYWSTLVYLHFIRSLCCRWRRSHSVLDFSSHCHKCLFYICCILSRRFQKWDSKLIGIFLESLSSSVVSFQPAIYVYIHTKHNIQNTGHKKSDANLKQKRNFGIQEFEVQHLYVLQTSGQSQHSSWKRQKVNSIWHMRGRQNDASFLNQTRKM